MSPSSRAFQNGRRKVILYLQCRSSSSFFSSSLSSLRAGRFKSRKERRALLERGRPKLRENEACGCEIGVEEYDAHAETDWWDTRKKLPFSSAKDALEKMSFNNSVLVMMTNAGEVDLLDNYFALCVWLV